MTGMSDPHDVIVDPDPPEQRCPRTGAPIYTRRPPLARLLRRARGEGVPGADGLAIRACPSCAGLHLVLKPPKQPVPVKPKQHGSCSKNRYRTEQDALIVLGLLRTSGSDARQEVRAYPCPNCKGAWHLTSRR